MAGPLVLFPDVEAWLIRYLRTALTARTEPYAAGVAVDLTLPDPRPTRSVLVRDTGGGRRLDVIRRVHLIGVNVRAATEPDATDLANLVAALVHACPDGNPVVHANETGPYPVDPDTGAPRRYLVAELTVRGTSAPAPTP